MDGRMRFDLNLGEEQQVSFKERKLQEIVLRSVGEQFTLSFSFSSGQALSEEGAAESESLWPEYVVIRQDEVDPSMGALLASRQTHLVNSLGVSP
jgi:hypothetical protein